MPVYLAKDYLSEYLNSNLEFLTRSLISEPRHLESENRYPHSHENNLDDGINNLFSGLKSENSEAEKEELIRCMQEATKMKSNGVTALETFDSSSPEVANQSNNIIPIDSDSDFDIGSSFGSTVLCEEEINKKVDSLMNPSLCSDEMKRSLPQDDWYLDLIDEDLDHWHVRSSAEISSLLKRLKPVRVSDPMKELSKFQGLHQLCSFPPYEGEEKSADCNASSKEFLRVDVSCNEGVELLLESSLFESCGDTCMASVDNLQKNLLEYIRGLCALPLEDEKEVLKLWTTIPLHVEQLNADQILSTSENAETINEPLETHTQVSPEGSSRKLDSPETSFIMRTDKQIELPSTCEKETSLQENGKLYVLSPKTVQTISKKCFREEKEFVDISRMVLPENDCSEEKLRTAESIIFPVNVRAASHFSMDEANEVLDWEPLIYHSNLIDATAKSLLEKVVSRNKRASPLLHTEFTCVPLGYDDQDMILDDWKQQEKRILSLRYITSCKKAAAADDIPLAKGTLKAPTGYHNPKFMDRKSLVIPKPPPLSQITPIPHAKKGSTCYNDTAYQSPLDSFMLLRMAKTPQSAGPDPRKHMVSAAKVKPMVNNKPIPTSISSQSKADIAEYKDRGAGLNRGQNREDKDDQCDFSIESKFDAGSVHLDGNMGSEKKNLPTQLDLKEQKQEQQSQPPKQSQQQARQQNEREHFKPTMQNNSAVSNATNIQLTVEDVIQIKLSGKYLTFILEISEDLKTLLEYLRSHGCISQDCSLLSLSVDRTKFLAKQEERRYHDGTIEKDVFCGSLCLHAVMWVLDTVVNCNVLAACAILKEMTLKYQSILDNCLEPLHKKLSTFYCSSADDHVVHPKLKKVHDLLLLWLKRNHETRTLLILPRMFEYLAPNLQTFLSAIKGVKVNSYPDSGVTEEVYIKIFHSSNVVLVHKQDDLLSCPWQFFNNVILFEQASHSWKTAALQANLENFVTFEKFEMDSFVKDADSADSVHGPSEVHGIVGTKQTEATVVCSTAVVSDKDLLLALENKCNIQLIVKKYERIREVLVSDFRDQPDILIDEKTGIVLVHVVNLVDENEINLVSKKVISTAMKCSAVYVMLCRDGHSRTISANIQNMMGKLVSHVSVLISNLLAEFPEMTCKLLHCFSVKDLAKKIQNLCASVANSPKDAPVSEQQSSKYEDWLDEELTSSEKFVMAYPSVNVLTAKLMLQKMGTVKNLLKLSIEELKSQFPSLPSHVLHSFFNLNHTMLENQLFWGNSHDPAKLVEALPRSSSNLLEKDHIAEECIVIDDEPNPRDGNCHARKQSESYLHPQRSAIPPKTPTAPKSKKFIQRASSMSMPNIASIDNATRNVGYSDQDLPPRTPKPPRRRNAMASVDISGTGGAVAIPPVSMHSTHMSHTVDVDLYSDKYDRQVPTISVDEENRISTCDDRIVPCTNVEIGNFSSHQNIENSLYDYNDTHATQSNHRNIDSIFLSDFDKVPAHGRVEPQLVPDSTVSNPLHFGEFQEFDTTKFSFGNYPDSQDSVESFKLNLPPVEDNEPSTLQVNNTAPSFYEKSNSNYRSSGENQMQYRINDNPMASNKREPFADIGNVQCSYSEGNSFGSMDQNLNFTRSYNQITATEPTWYPRSHNSGESSRDSLSASDASHMPGMSSHKVVSSVGVFSNEISCSRNLFGNEPAVYKNHHGNDWDKHSNVRTSSQFMNSQVNDARFNSNDMNSNAGFPYQQRFSTSDPQRRSFWNKNGCPKEIPRQAVKAFAFSMHNNERGSNTQSSWGKAPSETKKRRLGLKKVPGAKDGQTKLTFV